MTRSSERGQAMIELAIILTGLIILTAGLASVGLNFYQYNALAAAARTAARWAAVEGGTCLQAQSSTTSADWCNQLTAGQANFWNTAGNQPNTCVNSSGTVQTANFTSVSGYTGSSSTTIAGAIAHRFDTSSSATNTILGSLTPAFNLTNLKFCVQVQNQNGVVSGASVTVLPGDSVAVYVLYPFTGTLGINRLVSQNMVASAQYLIE